MKNFIGLMVLTVFLGGALLTVAGCTSPPYKRSGGSSDGSGQSGHSH